MTIVHVVQRLAPGGIEQLVLNLAHCDLAHTRIVSLEGEVSDLIAKWPALKPFQSIIYALHKQPGIKVDLIWQLVRLLKKLQARAVITHHIGPLTYAAFAARLSRVRALAHVEHDVWHFEGNKNARLMRALLWMTKPRLAAVSTHLAGLVHECLAKPCQTIHNGVDLQRFKPRDQKQMRKELSLDQNARIIGAGGRLESVKGFHHLVAAARYLPRDVHVVIFGEGSQRQSLEMQIAKQGLEQRVFLCGLSSAMERVYPAFDVFCLPSQNEGLPLSIIEAQACNLPVVAHDVGAVHEALCPQSSFLLPIGAPHELAQSLEHALKIGMTPDARNFVSQRFSMDQTFARYQTLVEGRI